MLFVIFFLVTQPFLAHAFQSSQKFPVYLEPELSRQSPDLKKHGQGLKEAVHLLADELFQNLEEPDPQVGSLADGLLVATFVEQNKLNRTSSFGRYLASQLMGEFQRYSYSVVDMRKRVSVMVQEKRGEFGLSRDPDEIPSSQTASAMLTGTYLVGENEIIVNAQILDNKTAVMLSSATVIFPLNSLGNLMLKDSASARKRQAEVIYMKRLEM